MHAGRMLWNKEDKCFESTSEDFKRKWRVKRAKKELIERFGRPFIRWAIVYAVVFSLALVTLIVLEATGSTHIFTEFDASVAIIALRFITGLFAAVVAFVPLFKLVFVSNKESHVSRGEAIFKQALTVRDHLGFLATVRQELQELFDYLGDFEKEVGTKLILVPIIDDLDRCITDGRNVKVLEAMQLILSVPGAPIISFLAVDSRIVVASIEEHYEKVFANTIISGHEYLDKIVQIPFALPEPPQEKVERLISSTLEGNAASPEQVAHRLKAFSTRGFKILTQNGSKRVMTFKVAPTRVAPGAMVDLTLLVLAIEDAQDEIVLAIKDAQAEIRESQGKDVDKTLELDSEQALKLVCAAARQLGPYLTALANQPVLMDKGVDTMCGMNKEEAVEILCQATNAALEAGTLGFEKVYMRMRMCVCRTGVCVYAMRTWHPRLTCICAALTLTHTRTHSA